jgi:hypothetical protein
MESSDGDTGDLNVGITVDAFTPARDHVAADLLHREVGKSKTVRSPGHTTMVRDSQDVGGAHEPDQSGLGNPDDLADLVGTDRRPFGRSGLPPSSSQGGSGWNPRSTRGFALFASACPLMARGSVRAAGRKPDSANVYGTRGHATPLPRGALEAPGQAQGSSRL